jgi:uncharacterized protein
MKKNVLITGGTGFIGRNLTQLLIENGYTVSILSRRKRTDTPDIFYYTWDVGSQTLEEEAVLKADYIVHLAGEGIADKRWTAKRKKDILLSREVTVDMMRSVLEKHNKKIEAFVSASAIGIYGAINGEEICTEETAAADDFLGLTCQKWEAAADTVGALGIRVVKIRTGLVLGRNNAFLRRLSPIFKRRLGAPLGSGKQYMPWIHVSDLCSIYFEAIKNPQMNGPYNAAINDGTTNTIFSKLLAKVYGYKIWLPNVPAFILKIFMGEMALIVLKGRRVSSAKIKKMGFEFKHKDLEETLRICIL